ncbi:hypothetical protein Pvag_pPag30041 (plasmid) [Pantoea vagans C9-1]|nr:hypothetical protein Pvag_pPag30041 [Pantoea vagans C9-1]
MMPITPVRLRKRDFKPDRVALLNDWIAAMDADVNRNL